MEINKNINEVFIDPDKLLDQSIITNSNQKIICKICRGILYSPIELFCEHLFCSHCLNNWSEQLNDKCPICNKVIYKKAQISDNIQNIINNLKFFLNNKIYTYNEYIQFLTFGQNSDLGAGPILNNQTNNMNNNINYKCNTCGKVSNIVIKDIKNIYEERNKKLTEELRKIYEYKRKLQGDLYKNKYNQDMPESTLIDKCKHFSGNYKPIFDCCNTAYGCYLCHDENECHEYQISKKVVCLLCACIYEGNECPNCKVKQCYEKKEN